MFLFLLVAGSTYAQDELWYFGRGNVFNSGGLQFPGPTSRNFECFTIYEAITVISDGSGNALFYSDGLKVYNKNNVQMPSGGGLLGSQESNVISTTGSSLNGVVAFKKPGSLTEYYIFTINDCLNSTRNGVRYNIVDMTQNGGLGDVTSKNNIVLDGSSTPTAEMMTAASKPCSDTIWVVVHGAGNNNFYAIPVSPAGVGAPVVTSVGPVIGISDDRRGSFAFNSTATQLAMASMNGTGGYIFNFNPNTGVVSNTTLGVGGSSRVSTTGHYGCAWSPDDQKVYFTSLNSRFVHFNTTLPYNAATNPSVIAANGFYGAVKKGADGKLYVGENMTNFLGTISSPNAADAASCGWNPNGYNAGTLSWYGLPNNFIPQSGGGLQATITNPVSDTSVCANVAAFQLTAAQNTGNWSSSPSGFVNSSGMFNPGAGAGNGPWTVTVYYGNPPCLLNDSVKITVTVCCPPVSTSAINDTCAGAAINLASHVLQGTGNWSIVSGPGGSIVGSTFTSNTAGTYTVRYTLSPLPGIGCTQYSEQTFTIKPLPVVNVADHSICQGDPAWVFDAGAGFNTYSWTGPVTGSSRTLSTSTQGTYNVTVTLNGCSATDQAVLTVNNKPTVTLSFSDPDVCINETPFALSGGSPSGGTYSGTGVSGGNFDPSVALVGPHTIKYKYTNGSGCSDSATAVLTVRALPLIDMDIPVNAICIDAPAFVLTGGNPTGGVYSGKGVSGGSFNPANAGAGKDTITYTLTDNYNCVASVTDTIRVHALPVVTLTLSQAAACIDATPFNLSGGSPVGGTYSGSGVGVSPLYNPGNAGGAGPKNITYTYTNPSTTCTSSATATLTVNALPSVSLADTSTCPGGTGVTLIPNPSNWAAYVWSDASTNPTLNVTVPNQTYWVRVTDNNGCKDSAAAFVAMGDTLHVDFGGPKVICANQTITLDAAQYGPFAGPVTYTWLPAGANQSTLQVGSTNLYGVLVMDGRGCVGGDTVSVTVHQLPSVSIPDSAACFTGKEFIDLSLAGVYQSIAWSTGAVSNNTKILKPGLVTVTVTNNFNCSASDTAVFVDDCEPTVLCFPNVVTPNGDGKNDEFISCYDDMNEINDGNYKGILNNILSIDFQVYNRWGIRVFQSKGALPRWDCTYQGNRASDGVYYWIVRYTDSSHTEYEQTGWMQVISEQ